MKPLGFLLAAIFSVQAGPLPPQEEKRSFRLADDALTVELVAAEPNVLSPVAITWDAKGRMFVAEMIDYPVGPGSGQVRMLEDLDGDGVYEKAVVFAEGLSFPNGVLPWKDGVLVTSAPNILFLRDADGDGRADERRVILTGFAEGNQQLRVNGLLWGLDGWVYGANGRSDGELRRPGDEKGLSLRGHDFRFKPGSGEFEVLAGRSQFGLARDDWGNRFLSWNTIAIRHEVIPERFLARNPNIPVTEAIHDLAAEGDKGEVFPLTPVPQTFNNESTSHFNALAGLTLYRGDALPERYKGNAFMGETLRNLVHRRVIEPSGPSFSAHRVEQGREFLASTDPWFHPVNFATGPDGALYIVDFYRQWVEHPGYVPEKFRDKFPWRTGAEHGRIWRVRSRDWKRPAFSRIDLNGVDAAKLRSYLSHPNGWWRDTASRLVLEERNLGAVLELQPLVDPDGAKRFGPEAVVQALYLLSLFGELPDLLRHLDHQDPRVRVTAVRLAETRPEILPHLGRLVDDEAAIVRLWTALVLGKADLDSRTDPLARLASRQDLDHTTAVAIRSSVAERPWPLLDKVFQQRFTPNQFPNQSLLELTYGLAEDVGKGSDANDRRSLAKLAISADSLDDRHLAVVAGFNKGAPKNDVTREELLTPTFAGRFLPVARKAASAPGASSTARESALQILGYLAGFETSPTLLTLLLPENPEPLQRAAAKTVAESAGADLFGQAFKSWERYQVATRRQLLAGATRSSDSTRHLIEAMQNGRVSASELDAATRQNLLRSTSGDLKSALQQLLGPPISADRAAVIEKFTPALQLTGDKKRGRELFEKACVQCHSIAGRGGNVGPTLSGIASRPKDVLLIDLLDPSRQVNPEFLGYSIQTTDGETLSGLLVSDNSASVTLRRPNLPDETIPRSRITSVQAGKLSLMPDGLETGLRPEDIADLLLFLSAPEP